MKFNGDIGNSYILQSDTGIDVTGSTPVDYAYFTQEVGEGVSFALVSKTWKTRELNTTQSNLITGLSLNTTTFTITVPAGVFLINAFAYYGYNCESTIFRLRDTTSNQTLAWSDIGYQANSGLMDGDYLWMRHVELTFSASTTLQLQQWSNSLSPGSASGGIGMHSGVGNTPLAGIEFFKIG